jgi:hypothetical protein
MTIECNIKIKASTKFRFSQDHKTKSSEQCKKLIEDTMVKMPNFNEQLNNPLEIIERVKQLNGKKERSLRKSVRMIDSKTNSRLKQLNGNKERLKSKRMPMKTPRANSRLKQLNDKKERFMRKSVRMIDSKTN